jgi:uncharacterized protein YutE (UPF0331/DUF86 family)
MVNPQRIEQQVQLLRRYLAYLNMLAQQPLAEFLSDPLAIGSTRYYLQVAIECCINIANHIISSEGLRGPRDYKDAFRILEEAKILPGDLARTMRALAGLRNLLVHLYWEVDDSMIHANLQSHLGDFETYISYIMRALGPTNSTANEESNA